MQPANPSFGKIQLKLVAFVFLFLAVSVVVTGFFVSTNGPKTQNVQDQAQLQKLADDYKKNQKLPKDVQFAKIKVFEIFNRRDDVVDARIELEDGVKFSLIDLRLVAPYFADVTQTTSTETKNLEEYIVPEETYYKHVGTGIWFIKYVGSKEAGVYLAIYTENGGFEKDSKLKFL